MKHPAIVITAAIAALLATAAAVRALARSRTVQLFSRPIARVTTSDASIALTFDDGPTDARVDSLLGILQSRGVHATFCLIGQGIAAAPMAARKLTASAQELGNHTFTHDHMVFRSGATTRAALPFLIDSLHARGYRIMPVGALLARARGTMRGR